MILGIGVRIVEAHIYLSVYPGRFGHSQGVDEDVDVDGAARGEIDVCAGIEKQCLTC